MRATFKSAMRHNTASPEVRLDPESLDVTIDDELIAWRSLPGSEVNNAGSVHFTPALQGNGTEVRVVLSYDPPAGKLGAAVAKLLGEEPSQQVEADLGGAARGM